MTPAPTTRSLLGDLVSDSAPVEETMIFSSISTPGRRATSEPVAMTIVFGLDFVVVPPARGHLDLAGRRDLAVPRKVDLVLLEQEGDAIDIGGDGIVLVLHHGGKIELRLADDDAERRETMGGLVEFLGGLEQRLRGDAADVEAGSAKVLRFSTTATLRPSCAARIAQT